MSGSSTITSLRAERQVENFGERTYWKRDGHVPAFSSRAFASASCLSRFPNRLLLRRVWLTHFFDNSTPISNPLFFHIPPLQQLEKLTMIFPSLPCEEGQSFDLSGQGDGNLSLLRASGNASAFLIPPLPKPPSCLTGHMSE